MVNARQIGGILMLLFAAAIFVWFKDVPVPVATALIVAGIGLIAASRKRAA